MSFQLRVTGTIQVLKKTLSIASIEQCLAIALEKNRRKQVSQSAINIAEAQHKQAVSSYWPQVISRSSFTRLDEAPNFIFPAETMNIGGMPVAVPKRDIKLLDRDIFYSSLDIKYPLFTGGKISSVSKQAGIGTKVARQAARRTDLDIILDVKRMYYGSILASRLRKIASDTRNRFKAIMTVTERIYQTGTGSVKKTDYLRTQVIYSSILSAMELAVSNEELARAALVNTMGLSWDTEIELLEKDIPFEPMECDFGELVADTYQFNPDWTKIELGIEAAEEKIKESRSGYFPLLAFFGRLGNLENSYAGGISTAENKRQWQVGLALELPIFKGFRTVNEVREAKERLRKIKHEKILLGEGLALQLKDAFLQINRAKGQVEALHDALGTATENRELNVRAYQDELVETRDVIESQILESFVTAQYYKALYDHISSRAKLDFVVGKEIESQIHGGSNEN